MCLLETEGFPTYYVVPENVSGRTACRTAGRVTELCHALSRTPGWTTFQVSGGLKLGESTFLNTLSRLAKLRASEEVSTYPNWKSPLCHAVSRTCHAVTLPGWPPGGDPALQTFGFQIALLWTEIRASYL